MQILKGLCLIVLISNVSAFRADYPFCPASELVSPCTCLQEVPTDVRPSLICEGVSSTDLATIFAQEYPTNKLLAVRIRRSDIGVIGPNFFSDKEVSEIVFSQCSVIAIVPDAFALTAPVVTSLIIEGSPDLNVVPWDIISSMPLLETLAIRNSGVSSIDGLPGSSSIVSLDFSRNGMVSLPEYIFSSFNSLAEINLSGNYLDVLGNYSLSFNTSNEAIVINLAQNSISEIDLLAFPVVPRYMHLNLARNAFSTIEELSFKAILDRLDSSLLQQGYVDLDPVYDAGEPYGNQIICDCSIAWYVASSNDRKNRLKNAFCEHNRQLISDLPSDYFDGLC
ncbi:uncharacterized protein LOC136034749 [Artemia franciscana]|uniref:uncharacterized protein LOC136034749 n=1 Tax=Artemia franciscana TaxID=6661 RepID=UPI0032DA6E24